MTDNQKKRYWSILRALLRRAWGVLHDLSGGSNYDRYLRHVETLAPDCMPLTRREFEAERVAARYSRADRSGCC
ncbi:MAG: YbdD/YjiX family protein [Gemmatimonadaceae bacterium]|nr:YbdD/YjiX family protein [Gemmatimonadaceae bacterium]